MYIAYTCISDGVCVIAVYVDHIIIIACKSLDYLAKIKLPLSTRYKMKDLGELHYLILGVNIVQIAGKILVFSCYCPTTNFPT